MVSRCLVNSFHSGHVLRRHLAEKTRAYKNNSQKNQQPPKQPPEQDKGGHLSDSLFNLLNLIAIMAPEVGLEPTTLRLTAECSAIELLRSVLGRETMSRCALLVITKKCF